MMQRQPKQAEPGAVRAPAPARPRAGRAPQAPHLQLQRALGNQGVQVLRGPVIQAKLRISEPEDPYEQEADRVADTVMRMPAPQSESAPPCAACASGGSTCPKCAARSSG